MKKLVCILMAAMMLVLCGCSSGADYTDAESFEAALNRGENVIGKTVTFTVKEVHEYFYHFLHPTKPYNLIAGEHLNFVTPKDREYKAGDEVTVKVTDVVNYKFQKGSWIINDPLLENYLANRSDSSNETNSISFPDSSAVKEEFKEKVLYDKKGLKVTLTGIEERYSGAELKVLIENNTSTSYTVQCRDFSINDFSLSEVFSAEVAAGKKAVDSITVYGMDDAGITVDEIKNVELKLHFYDSDKWSNSFDSEMIRFTL